MFKGNKLLQDLSAVLGSPQWGAADAEIKSHPVKMSLNVLPLKPGVRQYIAIHDTFTARDFFLAYFYPSGPFSCIFFKTSVFFLCLLWLTLVPVFAHRIK